MTAICLYESELNRIIVCKLLSSSIKLDTYNVWRQFCKCLGRESFQSRNSHDSEDIAFYWSLYELLQEWCSLHQKESKLEALLDALDYCELWEQSDILREAFSLPPRDTQLLQISCYDQLKQLGDHVSENCSDLCNSTTINDNLLKNLEETCSSKTLLLSLATINDKSCDNPTKAHEFYSSVRNNPQCLKDVIFSLEKDGQYKPAWILRSIYRKFDIVETVFKQIASNPYDVDKIINSAFQLDSNDGYKFSQVFYMLFPEFGDFSPAMKSFLGILSEFKFLEGDIKETTAIEQIFRALHISHSEIDGIFQFWVYLLKIYRILWNKCSPKGSPKIFNFMNSFPIQQTRVVILGQFPSSFCKPSGFAFHGCKSRSIKTILKRLNYELKLIDTIPSKKLNKLEIPCDKLKEYMENGLLDGWVQQGVLMFNALFTFRDKIWSKLTDFLVQHLNANYTNIVFIITGKLAAEKIELIDQKKHAVFSMFLPTPQKEILNADNPLFINTNFYLYQVSKNMIDWSYVSSTDEGDHCLDSQQERFSKYKHLFDKLLKDCNSSKTRNEIYFIKCADSIEDQQMIVGGEPLFRVEPLPNVFCVNKHAK